MKSCAPKDMPFLIATDMNAVIGNIHDNVSCDYAHTHKSG